MRFSFLLVFLFFSLYSAFFFFVALQLKGNFFFHFEEEEEEEQVDVVVVVIPLYLLCQWINIKRRKNKWSVLDSDLFPPVIADCLTVVVFVYSVTLFHLKTRKEEKKKEMLNSELQLLLLLSLFVVTKAAAAAAFLFVSFCSSFWRATAHNNKECWMQC